MKKQRRRTKLGEDTMDDSLEEEQRHERALNGRVLELFSESGGNSRLPCLVVQCFYASGEQRMTALKSKLEEQGYGIVNLFPPDGEHGDEWGVHAGVTVVPEPAMIDTLTDGCVALANELDCVYDGWYIEVQKISRL